MMFYEVMVQHQTYHLGARRASQEDVPMHTPTTDKESELKRGVNHHYLKYGDSTHSQGTRADKFRQKYVDRCTDRQLRHQHVGEERLVEYDPCHQFLEALVLLGGERDNARRHLLVVLG